MGKRGPKPTPTRVLQSRGSRRAESRTAEPQPPAVVPESAEDIAPPWPLEPAAREIWDQLVELLCPMGILTLADKFQLARYCRWFVVWLLNMETVEKEGATYPVYAAGDEAADPAETAPLEQLGLAESVAQKLGVARVATIADLERALADGILDQIKGIGQRTLVALEKKLQAWRSANPAEPPVVDRRQRPELWTANSTEKTLQKIEANFGLTPTDRVGLQVSEEALRAMNDKSKRNVLDLMGEGAQN